MSYLSQALLAEDPDFQRRVRSVNVQQADVFKDDERPGMSACADAVLKDDAGVVNCFIRLDAAGPGIADKADDGQGGVDQALVTDADLLALTQANWPVVAGLYFP